MWASSIDPSPSTLLAQVASGHRLKSALAGPAIALPLR
jgi:hypothetical protein